jgi:hypothetical protein
VTSCSSVLVALLGIPSQSQKWQPRTRVVTEACGAEDDAAAAPRCLHHVPTKPTRPSRRARTTRHGHLTSPMPALGVVSSLSREALYILERERGRLDEPMPPAPAGSACRASTPAHSSGGPAGASRSPAPARCSPPPPPPRPVRWPGSAFRAARPLRSSPAAGACSLGGRPRCSPAPASRPSAPVLRRWVSTAVPVRRLRG